MSGKRPGCCEGRSPRRNRDWLRRGFCEFTAPCWSMRIACANCVRYPKGQSPSSSSAGRSSSWAGTTGQPWSDWWEPRSVRGEQPALTSGRGFVHLDVRFISSKIYFVAKRSGGSARHTRLSASYESSRIGEGCAEEPIARHMRLLDLIAHGCCARVCAENGQQLPGADQFSETLRNCPL